MAPPKVKKKRKKARTDLTAKTKHWLADSLGYGISDKTEHWIGNPFAPIWQRKRKDLFNVIDMVAMPVDPRSKKRGIGIQSTSYAGVSARITKCQESNTLPHWIIFFGDFWIVGWKKIKYNGRDRWTPKVVQFSVMWRGNKPYVRHTELRGLPGQLA